MNLLTIAAIIAGALLVVVMVAPLIIKSMGLHPKYNGATYKVGNKKALIITTSHSVLAPTGESKGKATGVFGSEMTHPYYVFLEAGMEVDIASIEGGEIPIDPLSFNYFIISPEDKRYKRDLDFQAKVQNSMKIDDVDFALYDVVFLAGGWGAAYDLAQSSVLAEKISDAYYSEKETLIGAVCHGPLGLVNAKDKNGKLLLAGRAVTGVTDKQINELNITFTPKHPEAELKKAGAIFESGTAFKDLLATHVAVDEEQRFFTGQNQNSVLELSHKITQKLSNR